MVDSDNTANLDFFRESYIVFGFNIADKIVSFIIFLFFARYFEPIEFGGAYAVIGVSAITLGVPHALDVAVRKRISEDTQKKNRLFVAGAAFDTAYVIVCSGVLFLLIETFVFRYEFLALTGVAHLFGRSLLNLAERTIEGLGKPGASEFVEFLDGVITAALRLVLILGASVGVEGLIYGPAFSGILLAIGVYLYLFGTEAEIPLREDIFSLTEFFKWTVMSRIFHTTSRNSPVALLGFGLGGTIASQFKTAKNLTLPGTLVRKGILKSVFLHTSISSEKETSDYSKIEDGVELSQVITLPLVGGALVLGDQIMVTTYGSDYANTGYILLALMIVMTAETYLGLIRNTLNGFDTPRYVAYMNSVIVVLMLPALILSSVFSDSFIFFLLSIVIGKTIGVCIGLYYLKSSLGIVPIDKQITAERFISAGIMTGVIYYLNTLVNTFNLVNLSLVIIAGGITYFSVLLTVRTKTRELLRKSVEEALQDS